MHAIPGPSTPAPSPHPARRAAFLLTGLATVIALTGLVLAVVTSAFASAVATVRPDQADGVVAEGSVVTPTDDGIPAIDLLDPALREALRRAEVDAADDGVAFEVTSGWRSEAYQRWLLEEAIDVHGSEEIARRFVATPDRSSHVTGDAVDIGPLEAQLWLIENGSRYGICQTYANERWHFELATQPGGVCPQMKPDASG